jgi:ATP-dependent DNA helicase RecQ
MQEVFNKNVIDELLKNRFGFATFRPGQFEAINALLEHGGMLCIQPTGYGKSLLYQLPALLLDGLVIVISPLIALMRDQLRQLHQRFLIPAASINSDQTDHENATAKIAAKSGTIKILFVSPEQLDSVERLQFLSQLNVSLIVVDEAHCISTWGHDFRPSYRSIINLIKALQNHNPELKILALTATANHKTEADIKQQLSSETQKILVHRESMNRPSIRLSVISASSAGEKLLILKQTIPRLNGVGLIYCATQENTELVAEYLNTQDIDAASYHAGYSAQHKQQLQQDFLSNKFKVIAATNALGMGIDKQDLRFIIHFDIPGSITAYYQEVGRCGRDGLPAVGILLYNPLDKKIQEYFIASAQPTENHFQQVLSAVTTSPQALKLTDIKNITGLHPTLVKVTLAELIEQEFLQKVSRHGSQVYLRTAKTGMPNLQRFKVQFQVRTDELTAMLNYATERSACLMQILRNALGDNSRERCRQCSLCQRDPYAFYQRDSQALSMINHWMTNKAHLIKPTKIHHITAGTAVLDGKQRSSDFIHFMKNRALAQSDNLGLTPPLLKLIDKQLELLANAHEFGLVMAIPSRTWAMREQITHYIAKKLQLSANIEGLLWHTLPNARQGQLLNNDQRRENVHNKMAYACVATKPNGAILLIDDYIGSGATLQEAARALRQEGELKNKIIPFVLASVTWCLGRTGMI